MYQGVVLGFVVVIGILGILLVSTGTLMISNSSLYQSVHEKFFGKNLKDVMSFEIESKALSLLAEMIDNAENTDGYARTLILVGLYAILISFIGAVGSVTVNYRILNLYFAFLLVSMFLVTYCYLQINAVKLNIKKSVNNHITMLESAKNVTGGLKDVYENIQSKYQCCLDVPYLRCMFYISCKRNIYLALTKKKVFAQQILIVLAIVLCFLSVMAYLASKEAQTMEMKYL